MEEPPPMGHSALREQDARLTAAQTAVRARGKTVLQPPELAVVPVKIRLPPPREKAQLPAAVFHCFTCSFKLYSDFNKLLCAHTAVTVFPKPAVPAAVGAASEIHHYAEAGLIFIFHFAFLRSL